MIRTGTVRYADCDTVDGVAVQEGTATDRAQYDHDAYENEYDAYEAVHLLPSQDLNYPQFTATESTVRSRASGVQDSAGARAQRSSKSSRGMLPARVLTSAGTQSAGSVEAEVTTSAEVVMELLIRVAQKKGLKAAYTHSARGAAVASPFIIAGGMLLGPVGIFIGGAVGGFIGWMISKDFKSVPQILMELPAAEKEKLCAETMACLKNVKLQRSDASYLIKLVMSNTPILDQVLGVLTTFITKKLKAKPKYRK